MRTGKTLFLLLMASLGLGVTAQEKVLMKINEKPVYKSDFEYLYHKNTNAGSTNSMKVDEYVDLFVNYRLKVEEAIAQGLDKEPKFITEYQSYRNQLIRPYLEDTVSINTVAKEIYGRLGQNIEVSHILVGFDRSKEVLLPADTLSLYNKAMEIRKRLTGKKPEKFEDVALAVSEDPGVSMGEKPGYLGWASSLMFVAPFEDAMYALQPGEISMPVRSGFGYHLIKVHNKRKAEEANVAHIMFSYPSVRRMGDKPTQQEADSVKKLAQHVYAKIEAGENFENLCKEYSSDQASAQKGGELGWFSFTSRLPRAFVDHSFALENSGDISKPFTTEIGYHIVKLLGKKEGESWEQSSANIKEMLKRSDLYKKVTDLEISVLEDGLTTVVNEDEYSKLKNLANEYAPADSMFMKKIQNRNALLLTIDGKQFTVNDFAVFLNGTQPRMSALSSDNLESAFQSFKRKNLLDVQEKSIEKKHPELVRLSQEYHDGILLFNVMNKEVWDKALNDSLGLEKQFLDNRSKYVWDQPKFKGVAVVAKDQASLDKVGKMYKKIKDTDRLVEHLKEVVKTDSTLQIRVERGVWAKNENSYVDKQIYKLPNVEVKENAKYPLYKVFGKMLKKPESYKDIKGPVVSDYQNWLEETWIKSLREKYPVEINKDVSNTVQ